jgi:hypothetical protein
MRADINTPLRQKMPPALQRSVRDKKNIFSILDLRMFSAPNSLTTLYQLHRKCHIELKPYRISISITITLTRTLASWPVQISATIQKSPYMVSCLPYSCWLLFHNSVREYGSVHSMNMYLYILRYSFLFFLSRTGISYT